LAPTFGHPFGIDGYGRDQLTRVAEGLTISSLVGLAVVLVSTLIGLPLGILFAYKGGYVDNVMGRVLDVLFAFPSLLLALVLVTLLGSGLGTALLALIIVYVPINARFVRALTLAEKDREYVIAAVMAGASMLRVCFWHILPNIRGAIVVLSTNIFVFAVLAEAALSYLGVGAKPPTPSLGRILTENQGFLSSSSHLVLYPAIVLTLLVLSVNILGDAFGDQSNIHALVNERRIGQDG